MDKTKELRLLCEDSLEEDTLNFLKQCQVFSRAFSRKLRIQKPDDDVQQKVFAILSPTEKARLYDTRYPHRVSAETRELARRLIRELNENNDSAPQTRQLLLDTLESKTDEYSRSDSFANSTKTAQMSEDPAPARPQATETLSGSYETSCSSNTTFTGSGLDTMTTSWSSQASNKSHPLKDAGLNTIEQIIKKKEMEKERLKKEGKEMKIPQSHVVLPPYKAPNKLKFFEKTEVTFDSDGHSLSKMSYDAAYANTTQSGSTVDPLSLQAIHDQLESINSNYGLTAR